MYVHKLRLPFACSCSRFFLVRWSELDRMCLRCVPYTTQGGPLPETISQGGYPYVPETISQAGYPLRDNGASVNTQRCTYSSSMEVNRFIVELHTTLTGPLAYL